MFQKLVYEEEYRFLFFYPRQIFFCIKYYFWFKKFQHVYLFLDHRILGHFFNRFHISYHLIEDGLNFFRSTVPPKEVMDDPEQIKRYHFFFRPKAAGYGDSVVDIEVNDLQGIKKDARYQKMFERSRKAMFQEIDDERKKIIASVFLVKPIPAASNKKNTPHLDATFVPRSF